MIRLITTTQMTRNITAIQTVKVLDDRHEKYRENPQFRLHQSENMDMDLSCYDLYDGQSKVFY